MKKLMLLTIAVLLFLPVHLFAQNGQGNNKSRAGWGKNSAYCNLYKDGSQLDIKGEVTEIRKFYPEKGSGYGVEITVKSANKSHEVHLGPGWFMEKQELQLKEGDFIEVEGAEVDFNGRMVIMAHEIERGEEELKLRDENGSPVWW